MLEVASDGIIGGEKIDHPPIDSAGDVTFVAIAELEFDRACACCS